MRTTKTSRALNRRLMRAKSYDEWAEIAQEIDASTGADRWKDQDLDRRYDYLRIRGRFEDLRHARETRDNRELLFLLNEGIHGNLGGIANPALYAEAKFGTKRLISDYMEEVEHSIDHIAKLRDSAVPFDERIDFFQRASHCYGRSALMLSGAGSLTPFHLGVVKALVEQDLLPDIISGSSGGAIVAAVIGTKTDKALKASVTPENMAQNYRYTREKARFEVWAQSISPDYLNHIIEELIPDLTFEEAYERSGKYINISVATSENFHRSRLLNVITSPHVYVRDAVRASCSVPGVFPPAQLAAKDFDGRKKPYLPEFSWIDGAISDDLPARRLARLYGVNHFIASQTNPLILWAINDSGLLANAPVKAALEWSLQIARTNLRATRPIAEMLTKRITSLRTLSHSFYSVALQQYLADVTILPTRRFYDPRKLLAEMSGEEIRKLIDDGERSTWPQIELIRNSTRVSRKLDDILERYEKKAEKLMAAENA